MAQSFEQTPDEITLSHQHLEAWRQKRSSIWMDDFGQPAFYRAANSTLPAPSAIQNRIVFFGDSLTIAWDLDKFFPAKDYIDRGIGEQTTSQMLVRFRQDVIDSKPAVMVILNPKRVFDNQGFPVKEDERIEAMVGLYHPLCYQPMIVNIKNSMQAFGRCIMCLRIGPRVVPSVAYIELKISLDWRSSSNDYQAR